MDTALLVALVTVGVVMLIEIKILLWISLKKQERVLRNQVSFFIDEYKDELQEHETFHGKIDVHFPYWTRMRLCSLAFSIDIVLFFIIGICKGILVEIIPLVIILIVTFLSIKKNITRLDKNELFIKRLNRLMNYLDEED